MFYYAIYDSGEIKEAPCNLWTWSKFFKTAKLGLLDPDNHCGVIYVGVMGKFLTPVRWFGIKESEDPNICITLEREWFAE